MPGGLRDILLRVKNSGAYSTSTVVEQERNTSRRPDVVEECDDVQEGEEEEEIEVMIKNNVKAPVRAPQTCGPTVKQKVKYAYQPPEDPACPTFEDSLYELGYHLSIHLQTVKEGKEQDEGGEVMPVVYQTAKRFAVLMDQDFHDYCLLPLIRYLETLASVVGGSVSEGVTRKSISEQRDAVIRTLHDHHQSINALCNSLENCVTAIECWKTFLDFAVDVIYALGSKNRNDFSVKSQRMNKQSAYLGAILDKLNFGHREDIGADFSLNDTVLLDNIFGPVESVSKPVQSSSFSSNQGKSYNPTSPFVLRTQKEEQSNIPGQNIDNTTTMDLLPLKTTSPPNFNYSSPIESYVNSATPPGEPIETLSAYPGTLNENSNARPRVPSSQPISSMFSWSEKKTNGKGSATQTNVVFRYVSKVNDSIVNLFSSHHSESESDSDSEETVHTNAEDIHVVKIKTVRKSLKMGQRKSKVHCLKKVCGKHCHNSAYHAYSKTSDIYLPQLSGMSIKFPGKKFVTNRLPPLPLGSGNHHQNHQHRNDGHHFLLSDPVTMPNGTASKIWLKVSKGPDDKLDVSGLVVEPILQQQHYHRR